MKEDYYYYYDDITTTTIIIIIINFIAFSALHPLPQKNFFYTILVNKEKL